MNFEFLTPQGLLVKAHFIRVFLNRDGEFLAFAARNFSVNKTRVWVPNLAEAGPRAKMKFSVDAVQCMFMRAVAPLEVSTRDFTDFYDLIIVV